jgi:hypothetical protein
MGSNFRRFYGRVSDPGHWATFGGTFQYQNAVRRQQLRHQPIVVMQPVQHRHRHKSAAQRLRPRYCRIRIRYPVQSLRNAAVVVPTDEFCEYTSKMSFIPDPHAIETLPAKRPYQPLNVCRRIGRAIRNRYPSDAHLLPEPRIVCRSTRSPLPRALHSKRTTERTELPVVVVEQELGLLLEAGVPDLLFRPLKGWMIGYVQNDPNSRSLLLSFGGFHLRW